LGTFHLSGTDWQAFHGLLRLVIYGGRIDNIFDEQVLGAYLRHIFNDRLSSGLVVSDGIVIPPCKDIKVFHGEWSAEAGDR
jgi:hypothetical protein